MFTRCGAGEAYSTGAMRCTTAAVGLAASVAVAVEVGSNGAANCGGICAAPCCGPPRMYSCSSGADGVEGASAGLLLFLNHHFGVRRAERAPAAADSSFLRVAVMTSNNATESLRLAILDLTRSAPRFAMPITSPAQRA